MAAMRTALTGLCRRGFGNSGYSTAAAMGGRAAAPRAALLPSLRPAALRNLEGWRRFSTEGMEGSSQDKPLLLKHKFGSILHMLWQRSRDSVKNVIKGDKTMLLYIGSAAYLWFLASIFRAVDRLAWGSNSTPSVGTGHSHVGTYRRPIHPHPAFRF